MCASVTLSDCLCDCERWFTRLAVMKDRQQKRVRDLFVKNLCFAASELSAGDALLQTCAEWKNVQMRRTINTKTYFDKKKKIKIEEILLWIQPGHKCVYVCCVLSRGDLHIGDSWSLPRGRRSVLLHSVEPLRLRELHSSPDRHSRLVRQSVKLYDWWTLLFERGAKTAADKISSLLKQMNLINSAILILNTYINDSSLAGQKGHKGHKVHSSS